MDLVLPDVSSTVGPTWASLLNAALEAVDAHDHSTNSGVAITPAGLNINANLTMGDFSLTSLGSADLTDQASALASGSRRIFAYGSELYYRDGSGNNVQITSGGSVAGAAAGAISNLVAPASADYSAVNGKFTWLVDTGEAAKMAISDVVLYAFGEVSPNPVTIKSPAALASAYSITLPAAVPAATYPITMTSAGVLGNSGTIWLADGSVSAPSLSFAADTGQNTGIYYSSTGPTIGLAVDGVAEMTLTPTLLTLGTTIRAGSGLVSAPTYGFSAEVNTGWYYNTTGTFSATTLGVQRLQISAADIISTLPVRAPATVYTAASPAFSFDGDTDTGMYRSSSNVLGLAAAGAAKMTLSSTAITATVPVLASSGSAPAPGLSFSAEPTCGLYTSNPLQVTMAINGGGVLSFNETYIDSAVPYRAPDGSVSLPSFTFRSDTNTGLYWNSSGTFSASCNSSSIMTFSSSGIAMASGKIIDVAAGSVSAPGLAMSGTDTGLYSDAGDEFSATCNGAEIVKFTASGIDIVNGGIGFNGGTKIYTTVYSGSIGPDDYSAVTTPGTIYGAVGWAEYNGGPEYMAIENTYTAIPTATGKVYFYIPSCDSNSWQLYNSDSGSTATYKLVIHHI